MGTFGMNVLITASEIWMLGKGYGENAMTLFVLDDEKCGSRA